MEEKKDVTETSSTPSALQEAIASSPEVTEEVQQTQETQTPTAEQGETQEQETQQEEESRVPYSRLKEVVDEKNWLKQQLELQLQQRQAQQQFQQPTQAPQELGNTPEEREFWRAVREEARKVANQEFQQVKPVIDAGRMELAQMKVAQFRTSHPDIKPNSPEEMQIAERIQVGYTPDDAYWSIMGPRGVKVAEKQGEQKFKQQIQAKKKANVEASSSIPVQSQSQPKKSFREEFLENYLKAERGEI